MKRALFSIFGAFLVAIAIAQFAFQLTDKEGTGPGKEAWASDRMEFVAWNRERWTAWIHDGAFEQLPEDRANWNRHANQSIAYVNWDGESYQAKIDGDNFLLARHGDWVGDIEVADAIRYRDWSGNKQLRTVTELRR
jgi:hypothetical protein